MFQGTPPADIRDDKEIEGKGEILEKLLDLSALVDAMLLPTLTGANIAETLQEKGVHALNAYIYVSEYLYIYSKNYLSVPIVSV